MREVIEEYFSGVKRRKQLLAGQLLGTEAGTDRLISLNLGFHLGIMVLVTNWPLLQLFQRNVCKKANKSLARY